MDFTDLPLAFRYKHIRPTQNVEWDGPSSAHVGIPPTDWQDIGGWQPWHECVPQIGMAGQVRRLPQHSQVHRRSLTSIVWCPELQIHYIAPADCTIPTVQNEAEEAEPAFVWDRIYFDKVAPGCPKGPDGGDVYRMHENGWKRQLEMPCVPGFDSYLPRNAFRATRDMLPSSCHLVGDLSLILGLHAMCLEDLTHFPVHISNYFYRNGRPWLAMADWGQFRDRYEYPGRALVMQIGLIQSGTSYNTIRLQHQMLDRWETGQMGPIVSARRQSDLTTSH